MDNLPRIHPNAREVLEHARDNPSHVLTEEEETILGEAVLYVEAEIRHYSERHTIETNRIEEALSRIERAEIWLYTEIEQQRINMERSADEVDGVHYPNEISRRQQFENEVEVVNEEQCTVIAHSRRELELIKPLLRQLHEDAAKIYIIMDLDIEELYKNVDPRDPETERREEDVYRRAEHVEGLRRAGEPDDGTLDE